MRCAPPPPFFSVCWSEVFVGEWLDDLPKAGIYTQAASNPEQASAVPETSVLPVLKLKYPNEAALGVGLVSQVYVF